MNNTAPATLRQALQALKNFLQNHNSDAPKLAAQLLCMHALKVDKTYLITRDQEPLTAPQWQEIQSFAKRHAQGEPLAYIFGNKEFYGRDFLVNTHTLIPRPESEDVLEAIMAKARQIPPQDLAQGKLHFADIGTGSGCLACTFAAEIPNAQGFMLDISAPALLTAQKNAEAHNLQTQIQALQGTLYTLPLAPQSLHVLMSNPPYVSQEEFESLEINVRHFEPTSALVPVTTQQDPHGLAHIEALAKQAYTLLRQGGLCVIEHGCTQGKQVRELFQAHGQWKDIQTGQDLAGLDRYCLCEK